MSTPTPEKRAELRRDAERRRLFRFVTVTASDGYPSAGYESIDEDALALLDAADERDRLAAALRQIAEACHWSHDPHHAAQALAAAVKRVRELHVPDGEGCCRCCDYMTPHPCPTIRALDGTDE